MRQTIILISLLLFLFSCTPQKKLVYFQKPSSEVKIDSSAAAQGYELKIYPEDILTIELYTINPDAMPGISASIDKPIVDSRSAYEKGFVVDKNGNLDVPLLGTVHLGGLTLLAAKDTILNRFKQFVDDPVVVLKKLSFKITVLGEVNRPGLYYIPNEKMTFAEALGMAGDLTNYADRTDIKIFRKAEGGSLNEIKIDLTKTDILAPANRYVQQDDLIYIKAIKRKALANINPALVVFTSLISTTAITIAIILRLNNN